MWLLSWVRLRIYLSRGCQSGRGYLNCVINLVPDKKAAFQEIYRVLKSGGRFRILDIVTNGELWIPFGKIYKPGHPVFLALRRSAFTWKCLLMRDFEMWPLSAAKLMVQHLMNHLAWKVSRLLGIKRSSRFWPYPWQLYWFRIILDTIDCFRPLS